MKGELQKPNDKNERRVKPTLFALRSFVAWSLLLAVCLSTSVAQSLTSDAVKRGEELRRKWDLDAAEAAFREAVAVDPANLQAGIGLARIARARFDYASAIDFIERIIRQHPGSADALVEYGLIFVAAEEPLRARSYFEAAARLEPSNEAALIGQASVDLLLRDFKSATSRLRVCLAGNPNNSRALGMLARVLVESNKMGEAASEAQRALRLDPFDVEALNTLAFVRATERKPGEVRTLARRAVSLDPLNIGAQRLLSQYVDGRAGYEQKVAPAARIHYDSGRALKQEGRLREAVSEFEAALSLEPRYYRALVALGDVWLREGDYERAATAARLAKEVDADGAVAHMELSYAHRGIQERARIKIGATDFAGLYYREPAPPVYELTREIFPNYKSLTRQQQIVIDRAVAPLAEFLPALARSKARHYLLAFDERVSDLGGLDNLNEEKTFDGRYYASIRGVGGRTTVSGIEYLELAAQGGFNTIAHEFAHQAHITALTKDQVKTIRKLYEQARREGLALDFYAAANEYEYFAQGYEAFISYRKRPSAGITARHTNQELLMRDPDLHSFLVNLTKRKSA
ncbi:MAG TPA: tetratricopeptide repeat protein [Blastocatellia bacterium]|jgi:tetratricopeptide (TPR) repeat protein